MADDGMLMNFEIGDVPISNQVKFKGGRWRDRVKAQKSVKKWDTDRPKKDSNTPTVPSSGRPKTARYIPGVGVQIEGGEGDEADRPAKRPRTDSDAQPAQRPQQPRPQIKSGQTSSKLFTSNPTHTTTFDDKPAEETEEAKPSNAPLSGEAENFTALGLSRRIAQHLSTKLEMKAPTAIQKNTIPQLVKEDNDAFLQAETGSGKTLAYLLPIVQRITALSQNEDGSSTGVQLHRDSGLFAIVLAPTRELCKQIAAVLERLLRCAPWIVSTTVTGGESKKSEKARLRKGVNILIATPGRLTDHLDNTKVLDVGTVRWLVLDEGDRMMEMGFEDDLKTIVGEIRKDPLKHETKDGVVLDKVLPARRVTVLCSATMKMNVQKLGEISLTDAVHITATTTDEEKDAEGNMVESAFAAPSQLKQSYLIVPAKLRLVTLIALLKSTFARKGSVMKAIIFISCADSVNFHFDLLKSTAPPPKPKMAPSALPSPDDSPSFGTGANASTPKAPKVDTSTDDTVAPATYITSPANPSIILHKLHGSLPQSSRTATLNSFTSSKDPAVLITTDISSRGLDVPSVDLVVEYDPAFAAADHVHRVGRTARAGRPGKAVIFLQPGCEEGYVEVLKQGASSVPQPQLYDAVLQKGLSTPVQLPGGGETAGEDEGGRRNTWMSRAEALQLSIEQRLLVKEDDETENSRGGRNRYAPAKKDDPLLDAARQAFKSHVRAYATHVREERGYFDKGQLHLGHMAKSFGLREAPGGIGGGVVGRKRPANGGAANKFAAAGQGQKRKAVSREDDGEGGEVDEEARRRMKAKMNALAKAGASEFNIG
ncbi:DEAD-domain-containing protein [Coniochaeta ligniaria NRRL 30616]|uniref:ATP-dependent RNA helicase n=1 Tax=Coniochaeta ligniaria NRRL 30616 TaxID=1408157 RepID=A0A1J7IY68_9PEZI|nr:DEAD-domain-containing protein [Coniochaeta ligniaria NRRL 30616]